MTMNATQVSMNVKGVNKTGKVFKEIAASAASVGKAAALFGAAAAGSAAVAFAATAKSLGHLSDVAMQASTSTKELTKLSSAMGVLGIKSQTPEALAMAFQRMTKSIGETGVGGFKKAIAAIAQMETAEKRSAAAMAVFGKSGLDFMPLIEGAAKNGISALEDVMAGMPGIPDKAAQAGDDVADAMFTMANGSKVLWARAVGEICKLFDSQFKGGVREAALKANAYIEYFSLVSVRYVMAFFSNSESGVKRWKSVWGEAIKEVKRWYYEFFVSLAEFSKTIGWRMKLNLKDIWYSLTGNSEKRAANAAEFYALRDKMFMQIDKDLKLIGINVSDTFSKGVANAFKDVSVDDLEKQLQEKLALAVKAAAAVGKAAVGNVATDSADEATDKISEAMKRVRNDFIDAGSYKAASMSMSVQYGKAEGETVKAVNRIHSVTQKMESYLEKIAGNMPVIEGVAG